MKFHIFNFTKILLTDKMEYITTSRPRTLFGTLFGNIGESGIVWESPTPRTPRMTYEQLETRISDLEDRLEQCLQKKTHYKYASEPIGMMAAKKSFQEAQVERSKYMKQERSRSKSPKRSRSKSPKRSRSRSPKRIQI